MFAFLWNCCTKLSENEPGNPNKHSGNVCGNTVFSSSIVRILKVPAEKPYKKERLSVIKEPEDAQLTFSHQGELVSASSDKLRISLNTTAGKVDFQDWNCTTLLSEKDYGTQFTSFNDAGIPSFRVRQAFLLNKDEVIYGLG